MIARPSEPTELLTRYTPVLRDDSRERFTAVAVGAWTDRPGQELRRADGTMLAASEPVGSQSRLVPAFLGAERYGDGTRTAEGDHITGCPDPACDIGTRQRAHDRGHVYGHVATGADGRLWLSYWFFYLYNDYHLFGPLLGAGRHEGDWEMIQLRLDAAGQEPDLALYAQHQSVEARPWDQVERLGTRPVIYSARGCHACYYEPGWHWTGIWADRGDGRGPAPELVLEVVDDGDRVYDWIFWPGRWGGTAPGDGLGNRLKLDSFSPRGPGHQRQWQNPANLLGWVKPRRR